MMKNRTSSQNLQILPKTRHVNYTKVKFTLRFNSFFHNYWCSCKDIPCITSHIQLLTGLDGDFLSSCHEVNYTKSIGKECSGNSIIESWPNTMEAVINCNVDNACVGFYDENCDGNKLSTCKKFEQSSNLVNDCFYEKKNEETKLVTLDSGIRILCHKI